MLSLENWANVATIASGGAVIIGIGYGAFQVWALRKQLTEAERARAEAIASRNESSAVSLMAAYRDPQFVRASNIIDRLDASRDMEAMAQDSEAMESIQIVANTYEAFGVMVHRRILPLDIVDDLTGNTIVTQWQRLAPFFKWVEKRDGLTNNAEWFEWLASTLLKHRSARKGAGALVAHGNWKPQRRPLSLFDSERA